MLLRRAIYRNLFGVDYHPGIELANRNGADLRDRKFRAAALLLLFLSASARSEGIGVTGVESLLWPAIIVASPFIMVKRLLFGSDEGARKSTEKEADQILEAFKNDLPITGLNLGPLDVRWSLQELLVKRRIPFVEIGAGGSVDWLMSESKDPVAFQDLAKQTKILRLSLGKRSSPDCFQWKSDYYDFTKKPPVRPGTCLIAVFANETKSNLRIEVNAAKVSSRELRWDVVDQVTNKVYLSLPFWASQVEGRPLRVVPTDRGGIDPFGKVVNKLRPIGQPGEADPTANPHPYVMDWFKDIDPRREGSLSKSKVTGTFRSVQGTWEFPAVEAGSESWESGYERAYRTGKPVLLNNSMLIVPSTNLIGPACANPFRSRCDFSKQFLSEFGVITTISDGASIITYPEGRVSKTQMRVNVAARSFEGEVIWNFAVTPKALPEEVQVCNDFENKCEFSVDAVRLIDSDLVFYGHFWGKPSVGTALREVYFELVVPRSEIP